MRLTWLLPSVFVLLTTGCQRKLSATEIKTNLEKAMGIYLHEQMRPNMPPLRFDMVNVTYHETDSNYQCQFTIRLHRPDGSDTTGIISSKISKDFSLVTAK